MDNWLLQALVSNLVWELLIVGAGVGMAILRKRESKWVAPVLYGVVTVACLAVIWFTFTGRSLLSKHQPAVTPENIEANIKTWADNLAMALERTNIPESHFAYVARLHGGDPVEIFRGNEKPAYLQLRTTLVFSPEHQAIWSKLSKHQTDKATQELGLEFAKLKAGVFFGSAVGPNGQLIQTSVVIRKGVLIADLNEVAFSESFDEMTRATALVRAATNLVLTQIESEPKQPGSQ